LRVEGDVLFGKSVELQDDVVITNRSESQVTVPDGTTIDAHRILA
jgi:hypothetical protein